MEQVVLAILAFLPTLVAFVLTLVILVKVIGLFIFKRIEDISEGKKKALTSLIFTFFIGMLLFGLLLFARYPILKDWQSDIYNFIYLNLEKFPWMISYITGSPVIYYIFALFRGSKLAEEIAVKH